MRFALLALVVATSTGCVYRRTPAPETSKYDEIDRRLSRIEKMLEDRTANAPAIEKELGRARVEALKGKLEAQRAVQGKLESKRVVKKEAPPAAPAATHAFLGIKPVQTEEGVQIEEVFPGTGAERAELQKGDLILTVDGVKTGTIEDLIKAIRSHKIGATITLAIVREKKNYEVTATLGKFDMPEPQTENRKGNNQYFEHESDKDDY